MPLRRPSSLRTLTRLAQAVGNPNKLVATLLWTLCLFLQIEMILQASEYEQEQGIGLQDFFTSTHGKFKTSTGRAWAEEVVQRRAQQQQLHHSCQKAPDQVQADKQA